MVTKLFELPIRFIGRISAHSGRRPGSGVRGRCVSPVTAWAVSHDFVNLEPLAHSPTLASRPFHFGIMSTPLPSAPRDEASRDRTNVTTLRPERALNRLGDGNNQQRVDPEEAPEQTGIYGGRRERSQGTRVRSKTGEEDVMDTPEPHELGRDSGVCAEGSGGGG
jgi:hypothetical protein